MPRSISREPRRGSHFRVTNANGQGVSAALGVQVVDEAVFALAEKQPGFAKVFFYLEQEVMKPRFEIHSLSMEDIVAPVSIAADKRRRADQQKDLAARALFSATEMTSPEKLDTEFGRALPQRNVPNRIASLSSVFDEQVGADCCAAQLMKRRRTQHRKRHHSIICATFSRNTNPHPARCVGKSVAT